MTNIKISNRLKTIGDLIKKNSFIVDVGCDHALLSIYIYLNNKNINIMASDINEKPLKSAQDNLKKYGLEDKIKLVLSDGLKSINTFYDTVIISGVGGNTITEILKKEQLKNVKTIIVSPQNNCYNVRKYVTKLGFYISNEILVKENNKFYNIIKLEKGKVKYKRLELLFGPILLKHNDDLFKEYMNKKYIKYNILLNNIPKKNIYKRFIIKSYLKKIKIK